MGQGRPRKHPWNDWLDGERHVLNGAEHFPGVAVRSMRQQVLNEAAKRGVEVATRIKVDPLGNGVDYLEVRSRAAGPAKKIDWDDVLEHLPRRLIQTRDFTCQVESMRVRVYQAAARRGIAVTTEVDHGSVTVSRKVDPSGPTLLRNQSVTEMAPTEEDVR